MDQVLDRAGHADAAVEAAGDGPLLCLVDDAQWVDRASLDALIFAGRRLGAEGVVSLLAMRDSDDVTDLRGLGVVGLSGLSSSAAAALLAELAADLTPGQRDRLIEEAGGNPLALIRLAAAARWRSWRRWTAHRRAGLSTGARRVLDAFGSQVNRLPIEPAWRCWSPPRKTPANSVWCSPPLNDGAGAERL